MWLINNVYNKLLEDNRVTYKRQIVALQHTQKKSKLSQRSDLHSLQHLRRRRGNPIFRNEPGRARPLPKKILFTVIKYTSLALPPMHNTRCVKVKKKERWGNGGNPLACEWKKKVKLVSKTTVRERKVLVPNSVQPRSPYIYPRVLRRRKEWASERKRGALYRRIVRIVYIGAGYSRLPKILPLLFLFLSLLLLRTLTVARRGRFATARRLLASIARDAVHVYIYIALSFPPRKRMCRVHSPVCAHVYTNCSNSVTCVCVYTRVLLRFAFSARRRVRAPTRKTGWSVL